MIFPCMAIVANAAVVLALPVASSITSKPSASFALLDATAGKSDHHDVQPLRFSHIIRLS
jgi:hypothetical protein